MKAVFIVCAVIVGICVLSICYETANGYTHWYWRDFHASILVDGKPVRGSIHRSKIAIIITRRDVPNSHSYMIPTKDAKSDILDCGDWAAPSFFVFGIGHVNPP